MGQAKSRGTKAQRTAAAIAEKEWDKMTNRNFHRMGRRLSFKSPEKQQEFLAKKKRYIDAAIAAVTLNQLT